ncbi:MAG: protein kinase domain-containing protein [Phycicoccus sp.]
MQQHRTDVAPTGARDHLTPPTVEGVEVGELLAHGGTSEVWAGVRVADGRPVAVKVLHADSEAVELAAREAAVTARAANAHVVAVEAVLPLADGRVALLMPQLRGGPLGRVVRARGHLGAGEVVTVLAPVASALGRLHAMGVVHGDVSPGNVLLDLDGRPVLADLGLGRVLGEMSPGVWGTEGYVAPEILLGADPSPAADVYAVGALGWLCLSGAVPGPPGLRPPLHHVSRAGEGSTAVVEVIEAAVDADPAARPDADALAWALFQAAEPAPLDLVRGDDETSAVTFRLRAAAGRPPEPRPSRRAGPRHPRHARVRSRTTTPRRVPRARLRSAVGTVRPRLGRWFATAGRRRLLSAITAATLLGGGTATMVGVTRVDAQGQATARESAQATARESAQATAPESGRAIALESGRATARESGRPAPGRSTPGSRPVDADPRRDLSAPAVRPAVLLSTLAEARARAWREARPDLLDAAFAPGSPASKRDRAAVSDLASAGLRYVGLEYRVSSATTAANGPERAIVRATVGTGPYTVTGHGSTTSRPAVAGSSLLVDLVHTSQGWRVYDLRPGG